MLINRLVHIILIDKSTVDKLLASYRHTIAQNVFILLEGKLVYFALYYYFIVTS